MTARRCHPPSKPAFSLIELLVVIAILGLVLVLTIPAVGGLLRGSGVTSAGDMVLAALSRARQSAISMNRTVELRLLKYTDPSAPAEPSGGRFRALQVFVIERTPEGVSTNQIGRKVTLPPTACLASSPALSSVLGPGMATTSTGSLLGQNVTPVGLNYSAAIIRFYPDGSTSLPSGTNAYLTVVPTITDDAVSEPPANYATIAVEPISGKSRLHRP